MFANQHITMSTPTLIDCGPATPCIHHTELLKIAQRLQALHTEFEAFRLRSSHERSRLEDQLRRLLLENEQLKKSLLILESREASISQASEAINERFGNSFYEQVFREKNELLASLKQRNCELMEMNRRLNLQIENEAFEKENQKSNNLLALKEKDITIQRLKAEIDKLSDFSDKERLAEKTQKHQFKSEAFTLSTHIDHLKSMLDSKEIENLDLKRQIELLPKEPGISPKVFEARVRLRNTDHASALCDLIESREAQTLKAGFFSLWQNRAKFNRNERELNKINLETKISKAISKIREISNRLRDEFVQTIFSVFIRSVDTANKKKNNSLKLFIINLKDFQKYNADLFRTIVVSYLDFNELVVSYCPEKRFETNPANIVVSQLDQINQWIVENLTEAVQRRAKNSGKFADENEEYLALFRLLMLNFRAEHPIRLSKVVMHPSVKQVLNHCLMEQLLNVLSK